MNKPIWREALLDFRDTTITWLPGSLLLALALALISPGKAELALNYATVSSAILQSLLVLGALYIFSVLMVLSTASVSFDGFLKWLRALIAFIPLFVIPALVINTSYFMELAGIPLDTENKSMLAVLTIAQLGGVLLWIYLFIRFMLAVPFAALELKAPFKSSWQMTKGKRFKILLNYLMFYLLTAIPIIVIVVLIEYAGEALGLYSGEGAFIRKWSSACTLASTTCFCTTLHSLLDETPAGDAET